MKSFVKQCPVASFFVLTYVISWVLAMYTSGAVFPLFPDVSLNALNQTVKWAIIPVWVTAVLVIARFGAARLSRQPDQTQIH